MGNDLVSQNCPSLNCCQSVAEDPHGQNFADNTAKPGIQKSKAQVLIVGQKNLKSVIKIQAIAKGFLVRKKRATEKGLEDPKP